MFGLNAVNEALRAGRRINRIYVAKESHARGVEALLANAPKRHYLRFKTSDEREAYRRLLQEMI